MAENYLSKFDLEVEGTITPITIKDEGARSLVAQEITDRSALIKTDSSGNTLITSEKKITESAHDKETTITGANSTHVDGTNTVNVVGAHTEVYGSTCSKTVTGKNTVHYDGGCEEIHKQPAKITAPDITLDIKNGITYSKPIVLNEFFNYVNAKSLTGEIYKILTAGTNIADIGTGGGDVTLDMLAAVEENLKALIPSFSLANYYEANVPYKQSIDANTVTNMGYIQIPKNCLYISLATAECEITESYSTGAFIELEAGPTPDKISLSKERYTCNLFPTGLQGNKHAYLNNIQVYYSEYGVRLNYLVRSDVACDVWPKLTAIVIPFSESKTLPSISDTLQQYVNTRIATINSYLNNKCDSFVGVGDTHQSNNYYSETMIKNIIAKTGISKVIYGGDILQSVIENKTAAINEINSVLKSYQYDGAVTYPLVGNHDYNTGGGTITGDYKLTDTEIDNVFSNNSPSIITKGNTYYYYDNTKFKTRYIFLNTGIEGRLDETQLSWFTRAKDVDDGWKIMIFSHIAIEREGKATSTSNIRQYPCVNQVTTALGNKASSVIAWVCWHAHNDGNTVVNGVRIICLTCDVHGIDATTYSVQDRTEGTINEQSFNVLVIDHKNSKLKIFRLGAGWINTIGGDYSANDQEFSF